jgi:LacI family transcriptional regulator
LDRENRSLLRRGRLAFVLHHDLRADLGQAFQQITAYHKLRPPVSAQGPADVQIITPANCPRD